jgi:hypothetical protein
MIRIEAAWLAVAPLGMRAGTDTALARVVAVFGAAHPHAYLFAKKRASRVKVLVHDGIGIWLCARRLHQGRFVWPSPGGAHQRTISRAQLDALVLYALAAHRRQRHHHCGPNHRRLLPFMGHCCALGDVPRAASGTPQQEAGNDGTPFLTKNMCLGLRKQWSAASEYALDIIVIFDDDPLYAISRRQR